MARTNNLTDFLSDVADAIRTKKGTSETILASDFDTEIENLPSGGGADLDDYFVTTVDSTPINGFSIDNSLQFIKKAPEIVLTQNVTKINTAFSRYSQSVAPKLISEGTITQIYNLFSQSQIKSADLTGITNCTATDLSGLFQDCKSLESVTFGNFDTSNATTMNAMFYNCYLLTTLDIGNFNTSKVTNMSNMFYGCSSLTTLDLSSFETPRLTNVSYMFSNCSHLEHLDIRKMTFDLATSNNGVFGNIPSDCEIIVKSQTEKDWVLARRSTLTNVKTVAEYEAEQNA